MYMGWLREEACRFYELEKLWVISSPHRIDRAEFSILVEARSGREFGSAMPCIGA